MPNSTTINWTDYSSNLIRARRLDNGKTGHFCTMANSKCVNCYAQAINLRFGTGLEFNKKHSQNIEFFFHQPEADKLRRLNDKLAKRGETAKVFVSSMTDLFQETMPWSLINRVFQTIVECPNLTFQVLTKRANVAQRYFKLGNLGAFSNVWFGLTPECDGSDIPALLEIPAVVRWLSLEPLLADIDLKLGLEFVGGSFGRFDKFDDFWIVVGGESGPKARPTNVAHIRSIVRQAERAKIPVWVKQLGSRPFEIVNNEKVALKAAGKGENFDDLPSDLRVRQLPGMEAVR